MVQTLTCIVYGIVLNSYGLASYPLNIFEDPFFYYNRTLRCNCRGKGQCDDDGKCLLCERPYIGITCQNVDIKIILQNDTVYKTYPKIHDGDDSTCVDPSFPGTAVYTIKQMALFFWVYVSRLNKKDMKPILKLSIHSTIIDITPYYLKISENSLLIKIQETVLYNRLELTNLPRDSCSVDISLGRNLALSATATQSSTDPDGSISSPWEAINGQEGITVSSTTGRSCSATGSGNVEWWKARLKHNARINVVYLLNVRNPRCRLQMFNLKTFTESGDEVFNYDDKSTTTSSHYMISVADQKLVREVKVTITKSNRPKTRTCVGGHKNYGQLVLCEVHIYGEFNCPDNLYGPLCETSCPDGCRQDLCDPDWRCIGGCRNMWRLKGPWCLLEPNPTTSEDPINCPFRYGKHCEFPCSDGCAGLGDCKTDSGACIQGCKPGVYVNPPNCTRPCLPGTFGMNCEETCKQCSKNWTTDIYSCDAKTGRCLFGCGEGFSGSACEKIIVSDNITSTVMRSFAIFGVLVALGLVCYRSSKREADQTEYVDGTERQKQDGENTSSVKSSMVSETLQTELREAVVEDIQDSDSEDDSEDNSGDEDGNEQFEGEKGDEENVMSKEPEVDELTDAESSTSITGSSNVGSANSGSTEIVIQFR